MFDQYLKENEPIELVESEVIYETPKTHAFKHKHLMIEVERERREAAMLAQASKSTSQRSGRRIVSRNSKSRTIVAAGKKASFNNYLIPSPAPSDQESATNLNLTRDYGDTLMLTSLPINDDDVVESKSSKSALSRRKVSHQPVRQAFTQLQNFSNVPTQNHDIQQHERFKSIQSEHDGRKILQEEIDSIYMSRGVGR